MKQRVQLRINGVVQGVGFRPYVWRLSKKLKLGGFVFNDSRGVTVELEGETSRIKTFINALKANAPSLSRIKALKQSRLPLSGEKKFFIKASKSAADKFIFIPADICICKDCLRELFDKKDRRQFYPFINCTNCGPRFTIIKDIPYDREKTTMKRFKMCSSCLKEYHDPANRRFHAQPNACFDCGPQIRLLTGISLAQDKIAEEDTAAILDQAAQFINQGKIIAIKGIGGYHLGCDAKNTQSVKRLRKLKERAAKPFALMVDSLAAIADFCYIGKEEKWLLESPQRPIVLLKIKKFSVWMNEVAPQQKYLGAILAYSPLHYLIFYFLKKYETLPILVMTSANKNDFALVADERELTQIKEYADYFLVHNRPIHTKCDDSIARVFKNQEILIRKARGYTPDFINFRHSKNILSCGAELKNTFSIAKGGYLISSPYLGDLKNYRNYELFLNTISRYKKNFCFEPEVIAYDLNSAYLSTQYALSLKQKTKFAIQHHHAHIAACRFENDLRGETIGICFDGAGLGLDNAVWGGEFFITDKNNFIRAAHFKYFGLLGADKSAQEPARAAFSILYDILKENLFKNKLGCLDYFSKRQKNIFLRLMENKSYVLSSSAGRLFDAAASLLNIKHRISYEAEAAILLEMFSSRPAVKNKSFDFYISKEKDKYLIDWQPVFLAILDDLSKGEKKGDICYKFHLTFAKIIAETAELLRKDYGINNIVLSGGVFQNFLLLGLARQLLQKQGFKTYYHKRVPTNDSGISVGQAVIANENIK